jgi:hypothetical protein
MARAELKGVDRQKGRFVLLDKDRLLLGPNPFEPTSYIDFAGETVVALASERPPVTTMEEAPLAPSRKTGDYWFEISGRRVSARSQKELLVEGLRALERASPGTLEKLSKIRGRSKAIVSRDPNTLFNRPHLVAKFAYKLMDGWWLGTNNNANETNNRLQEAAGCAGLKWGETFKTSLTLDIDELLKNMKLPEPA